MMVVLQLAVLGNLMISGVLAIVAGLIISVDRHRHGRFHIRMRIRAYAGRHIDRRQHAAGA